MKTFIIITALLLTSIGTASELPSYNRCEKKIVIVTGASKGIGMGIAATFAKEGATVVLAARTKETLEQVSEEITQLGGSSLVIPTDISDPLSVQKMVDITLSTFGRIDVLCHNAGIYPFARLENMNLTEWRQVIDVNLTGTFLAVQACLPSMISQKRGKIIITSSISGPKTGLPGVAHYTASKGGVSGFIKTAAIELAKYNIQVNGVEPGNILTESLADFGDAYLNSMKKAIPAGRLGTPEDIAYTILFLASEEANFITGQSIVVDGGQTLPESHYSEY
ncbi:MAG: 3-oxoacyl-[acyl-carrier-protein] reductase FabG [Chlamydiia bacterium]|nr:3-oxoacyl-[acyl-carrier-protein] reductase FabG [Chlamydiia bacterium]